MSGYKIVSSIKKLEALNSILHRRPAGRNIIDYAREEIERLRAEHGFSTKESMELLSMRRIQMLFI